MSMELRSRLYKYAFAVLLIGTLLALLVSAATGTTIGFRLWQLTNASGTVTDLYDYDAFGNLIYRAGTTSNDYLYSGEQFDANLGFYYLRARYMNPSTGRFLVMDPLAGSIYDPASLHR
jgi:RHS repeat-associated protein